MPNGGAVYWRIKQLEESAKADRETHKEALRALEAKVDRLTLSLIGFSFTIAASAVAVVLFVGTPA